MPPRDFTPTIDPIVDITRRRLLTAIPALGVFAAGVNCGDDDDDAGGEHTTTPGATNAAFPVTIAHEFGETTVEKKATRIVAAGFNEVDFILAFGEKPVGIRDFIGTYPEETRPWARDLIKDTKFENIGGNEIDFEKVASLDPDLIMAVYAFLDDGAYAKLSGIAPTVAGPQGGATWKEQTRMTGQALGMEARAEELVADAEQRVKDAIAAHPEFKDKSLAILWGVTEPGAGYYLLPETDLRAQFFYDFGFVPPATTGEISADQAQLFDTDAVVVFGWTEEQMAGDRLFQGLDAVTGGHVLYFAWESDLAGALGFSSPLSIPYAVDVVVPLLADAVKGAS